MKTSFLAILLVLSITVRSQTPDIPSREIGESSLFDNGEKARQQSVTAYGQRKISIPIHTITLDGVSIPIELVYNPNAIRVDAAASNVGFGWDLNIPVKISRRVNMLPDDVKCKRSSASNTIYRLGFGIGGGNFAAMFFNGNLSSLQKVAWLNTFLGWLVQLPNILGVNGVQNGADTEPDIYSYTLPMGGGLMLYDNNQSMRTVPYADIDIDQVVDNSNVPNSTYFTKGVTSYIITDDNAVKYVFDQTSWEKMYTGVNKPVTYGCGSLNTLASGSGPTYECASTWLPSKVITTSQSEILFSYSTNYTQENFGSASSRRLDYANPNSEINSSQGLRSDRTNYSYVTISRAMKIMTQIETRNEKIIFEYNLTRSDILGSNALTAIKIYSKINGHQKLLKHIKLSQSYFITQSSYADNFGPNFGATPYRNSNLDHDIAKRLRLDSIAEIGLNYNLPSTTFTYKDPEQLPLRYSIRQDIFGFFNGNNAYFSQVHPTLYVYPSQTGASRITPFRRNDWVSQNVTEYEVRGINRLTNSQKCTVGVLSKIKHPTGGSTEYEFEPHTFFWGGADRVGGGLRLRKITQFPVGGLTPPITAEYNYTDAMGRSSGRLQDFPYFGHVENSCGHIWDNTISTSAPVWPTSLTYPSATYFDFFTWVNSHPKYRTGQDAGNFVAYERIIEINPGSGKKVVEYDVPYEVGKTSLDSRFTDAGLSNSYLTGQYAEVLPNMDYNTSAYSASTDYYELNQGSFNLNGIDLSPGSYYSPVESNLGWATGTIKSVQLYNEANQLVSSSTFEYQMFKKNGVASHITGLRFGHFQNVGLVSQTNVRAHFENFYLNRNTYIADVAMVPSATTHTEIRQNGAVSVNTTYGYGTRDRKPRWRETRNSDDSRLRVYSVYAHDYTMPPPMATLSGEVAALQELVESNSRNILIDMYHTVKSSATAPEKLISATHNEFGFYSPFAIPKVIKQYRILPAIATTGFTPPYVANNGTSWYVQKDQNFAEEAQISRYNSVSGVPEEFTHIRSGARRGIRQSFNNSLPTAIFSNASFDDVAYTSFEDDADKGGWNYYHTPGSGGDPQVVTTTDAVTGRRVYVLTPYYPNPITRVAMDVQKKYTVSLWSKDGTPTITGNPTHRQGATIRGWTYHEYNISNVHSVSIASPTEIYIDELRLYPVGATMTTTCYDLGVGKNTVCDERNNIIYFEYNEFSNLTLIQDIHRQVVKKLSYKIASSDN